MSKKELIYRYVIFIFGIFVMALGISLITKAQLGTSPISSVPFTLSIGLPLTMGTFTFLLNMVLIIGQMLLLKKNFKVIQLMQIPVSVIFGYFIDLTMSLFSFVNPNTYILKLLFLLVGCLLLALGVSLEVIANVVMLSGEAFVKAISTKFNKEFGTTKVGFDVTLVVVSITISLFMFHKLEGVREGTIIAAFTVGFIAKFFSKAIRYTYKEFITDKQLLDEDYDEEANISGT